MSGFDILSDMSHKCNMFMFLDVLAAFSIFLFFLHYWKQNAKLL